MSHDLQLLVPTTIARAGFTDHQFCGHKLYDELVGSEAFAGLIALALGRNERLSPGDVALLDDVMAVLAVADPHIWPLKVVRLAASYGQSMVGVGAGILSLEGAFIGVHPCNAIARLLDDALRYVGDLDDRDRIEEAARRFFLSSKTIPGFGVPFRPQDERVVKLTECVRARGCADRPYWKLFLGISEYITAERGLSPNIGSALGAVALDLGFLPERVGLFALCTVMSTLVANAREGAEQEKDVLKELPAGRIRYRGPAARVSPRALRRTETSAARRLETDPVAGRHLERCATADGDSVDEVAPGLTRTTAA